MSIAATNSLTDKFRCLLEAVTGACEREKRWGLLAGPMALLMWFRTRRERKEAAAAMEQIKGLLTEFVALLEEAKARKADAAAAPAEEAPHPPASVPIFASENGRPSRARPSPQSRDGKQTVRIRDIAHAAPQTAASSATASEAQRRSAPMRISALVHARRYWRLLPRAEVLFAAFLKRDLGAWRYCVHFVTKSKYNLLDSRLRGNDALAQPSRPAQGANLLGMPSQQAS